MTKNREPRCRNLVVVLGDQLDADSAAFDGFSPEHDAVLQIEVLEEASYIPQHKLRLAYFFASMRHFRRVLQSRGYQTHYVEIDDPENTGTFEGEIERFSNWLAPQSIIVLEPGDWRVASKLRRLPRSPEIRPDRHFLCSKTEFSDFAQHHPGAVMETFYRFMRRKLNVLMDRRGRPVGGGWNFDAENRKSLRASKLPPPFRRKALPPDETRWPF